MRGRPGPATEHGADGDISDLVTVRFLALGTWGGILGSPSE
ncbi:MAG TPA: hypothetical protein VMS00_04540 [Acidimicrobiales bacterium]|nr:hypothetical protein [Acidimicrobiales bacterium]